LGTSQVTCLAEDPACDFLGPQMNEAGDLFFIRRPYSDPYRPVNPLRMLWGIITMPFRLLYAVFQFLNFFTLRHTGQQLLDARDVRKQDMDMRHMMVWGNLINAEEALRQARRKKEDTPALVPKSWELIRKGRDTSTVLAKGVLSFDLAADGTVIYTNGSAIYRIGAKGKVDRILKESFIEQVVVID